MIQIWANLTDRLNPEEWTENTTNNMKQNSDLHIMY